MSFLVPAEYIFHLQKHRIQEYIFFYIHFCLQNAEIYEIHAKYAMYSCTLHVNGIQEYKNTRIQNT